MCRSVKIVLSFVQSCLIGTFFLLGVSLSIGTEQLEATSAWHSLCIEDGCFDEHDVLSYWTGAKNMKQKQGFPGFGMFAASCAVMLLAGFIGEMWTVFITGLVFAGVSLFWE